MPDRAELLAMKEFAEAFRKRLVAATPHGKREELAQEAGVSYRQLLRWGKQREGKQPEGKQREGKQPEGKQPEGKQPEGKRPEGKQPEGKRKKARPYPIPNIMEAEQAARALAVSPAWLAWGHEPQTEVDYAAARELGKRLEQAPGLRDLAAAYEAMPEDEREALLKLLKIKPASAARLPEPPAAQTPAPEGSSRPAPAAEQSPGPTTPAPDPARAVVSAAIVAPQPEKLEAPLSDALKGASAMPRTRKGADRRKKVPSARRVNRLERKR